MREKAPLPHEPPLGHLPRLPQRDQQLRDAIRQRGGEGCGDLGRARRAGQASQRAVSRTAWDCSAMRASQGRS
jgi:hypothetical protein